MGLKHEYMKDSRAVKDTEMSTKEDLRKMKGVRLNGGKGKHRQRIAKQERLINRSAVAVRLYR
jgi:hypothetical protein